MAKRLIQIVPALPPATNGVGDYALAVARVLRRDFGIDSCFLVDGERWQEAREVEGFPVRRVEQRSASALVRALQGAQEESGSSQLLLQLSGYGYSPLGSPQWLLGGLKEWKLASGGARLATMFHELFASAPPWRRTFWAGLAQKAVMKAMARHSEIAVTNLQRHRAWLERSDRSKRGKIQVLAVPSTVGEPDSPGELLVREPHMVVFGHPASRKRTYETQMASLQSACAALGIREVDDVGPAFAGIPERIGNVPVRKLGRMEPRELSSVLLRSQVGFVAYPRTFLGKSTIFAAYCAHRMLPVIPESLSDGRAWGAGAEAGVHYLAMDGATRAGGGASGLQRVADAAWHWYQGHSLQHHARLFAEVVGEATA